MENRVYHLSIGDKKIGTTHLEKADAPMGVASGLIRFIDMNSPYEFIKNYCKQQEIVINTLDEELGLIDTQIIPNLKVFKSDGIEIKGAAEKTITGMVSEGYEITILGIPYPFYEYEFPHHVRDYENQFK